MSVLMEKNSIDENSSVSSVLNVIPAIYDTAVNSTRMSIDEAVVRRAADKIAKAAFVETDGEDIMLFRPLIKYATIMVSTIPMLVIYPFAQMYFVTGVMIGAIKG